jgi:hypothetical protein
MAAASSGFESPSNSRGATRDAYGCLWLEPRASRARAYC